MSGVSFWCMVMESGEKDEPKNEHEYHDQQGPQVGWKKIFVFVIGCLYFFF